MWTLAALAATSVARAGEVQGTISNLIVRDSDGLVYVALAGAISNRAACAAATSYWMITNENSEVCKKLYTALLAAQLAGKTVQVVGKGVCVRWGDGEDILYINVIG
jgi:negative regulator of replication initiation